MRVILTGATGMVGEGVLHECLRRSDVEEVLLLSRRPCGVSHEKLEEIVLPTLDDFQPVADWLVGYDACLFCLGVTSVGKDEAEYTAMTYDLTMGLARLLAERNSGMTFCYVSGAGTDETERGRLMWARVKGKTENDLRALGFKAAYAFRPGYIRPTPGLKNTHKLYGYIDWLYPLFKAVIPAAVCTLDELSRAMLASVDKGYDRPVLEARDIVALARGG